MRKEKGVGSREKGVGSMELGEWENRRGSDLRMKMRK